MKRVEKGQIAIVNGCKADVIRVRPSSERIVGGNFMLVNSFYISIPHRRSTTGSLENKSTSLLQPKLGTKSVETGMI